MLREVENIYEKRKEIQRPLHVCLTQYFLENKMKEHKQVLQDFVRLPSDLKKHSLAFGILLNKPFAKIQQRRRNSK